MKRPRFTLAQLMTVVLYLGVGFAALGNANQFWASAVYTLAVILIALALVGALAGNDMTRPRWVGFAIFGWTYLLIVHLPEWRYGALGFGPIPKPHLLIEWGTGFLQPYIKPLPKGMGGGAAAGFLMPYEQVSQSLGIILFGQVGAIAGRLVADKKDQPNR
jgi:hypothetical protein